MAESQQKGQPPLNKGNPGRGVRGKVAFSAGDRSWTETIDVIDLAARVLEGRNVAVNRRETWLELPESGFVILPQIVGFEVLQRGGVRTTTTIQVHHPALTPDGVFEYQHSWGDTVAESLSKGFDQWAQVDLVAFQDALLPKPATCLTMEMSFPEKEGKPAYWRRAVLSPVAHFRANPPAPGPDAPAEEHPFCACCFLTNTFLAFKGLIEADGFFALRLFGARDPDGSPQADCRVNGEDWPPGAKAVRAYVQTWPGSGYEFRKQYVLLQTIEKPAPANAQGR